MIPISDDNPTLRFPTLVTIALLVALGAVWVLVQGAGFSPTVLAASVCNLGLVPGELDRVAAPVGQAVPLGQGLLCVVDRDRINILTPLFSMFLHGGWMHLLGNGPVSVGLRQQRRGQHGAAALPGFLSALRAGRGGPRRSPSILPRLFPWWVLLGPFRACWARI